MSLFLQYAIVFKTPPYYNMAIERPVTVQLALRRPSDKELSDSKPFTYLPQEYDEERIGHKRRKKIEHFSNFFGNRMAPMPPPSGGGPTGGGDPSKWPLIAFSCDLPYFTIGYV